jgi:N-glycosylase/DNA lyase
MIFTFAKERNDTGYEDHHANFAMEFESENLADIVSHFEDFLKGCGFVIEGHLDFVEDEDERK